MDSLMLDLRLQLDQIAELSPAAILLVAFAGLVMGIAPSSPPLYSVVTGYIGGQAGARLRGLTLAGGFVLGMATVDLALGALFGALGGVVIRLLTGALAFTNLFLAAVLALVGLALLRKIHIQLPVLSPVARPVESFASAYALGIPFGLSVCPACTPMVLPILGAAALSGGPWLGGILLLVFGLARGIPLLIVGTAAGAFKRARRLTFLVPAIERVSGVLLLLAAGWFLYQSAAYAGLVDPILLGL